MSYEKLVAHARETALLHSVAGLVFWDEQTYLPAKAGAYRAEQHACLAGLIHRRRTAPAVGDWLEELAAGPLAEDPTSESGCVIAYLKRRRDKLVRQPAELVEEISRTASKSHHAWAAARKADDYASFRPWLEKMIELRRAQAEAIGYDQTPYDALLDEYEPGESTENVARVLSSLREELTPLVAAINESGRKPPSEILARNFPVETQESFGKRAAAAIGFDFDAGRLDVTTHPFCGEAGPLDVRLTTRYQQHDFGDGFFSILHETGHGLYEQGLPAEHFGLPTGEAISLGIHESQSRMWENLVARSRGFWEHFFAPAQDAFPEALGDVQLDDWIFAVNESKPSLIRTESDEATYNLHIVVRFELERALIEGDLTAADLPAAWNDAYTKTLGVTPPNDSDGVLQDIHWSEGMFGYFPTYALGNLYAAQLFDQAERDLGPLESRFAEGDFGSLLGWLREKVHQHGCRLSAEELAREVTGEPLSHDALMRHLRTKFGRYYGLAVI